MPPLWLCLHFPSSPTTRPPSPFAPPPWPAAFSAHGFSSCQIHHPLPSSPSPPPATSPALSSSSIVDHCRSVLPWPDLWCCQQRVSDLPPLCFPPMPPIIAHFFCLCTLHSRKHSHIDEHDRDNDRDTSEEGGDEEDDEKNTPDPEVHGAPMYQEFIAGQERKEPPGEATLGNINVGLQKDPAAPNYDVVAVFFIVVALLCRCDAFPPPSSSSASPSALAP